MAKKSASRATRERRPAKVRLKIAQEAYEKFKVDSEKRRQDFEVRIARLVREAQKEESAADVKKRYEGKSEAEINAEYEAALAKVQELNKIRTKRGTGRKKTRA